ncbi:MAG: DNA-processing protein DprA [Pseudomonadota bacterium]
MPGPRLTPRQPAKVHVFIMAQTSATANHIPLNALPRTEDGQIEWLRLVRSARVGPATFMRLIRTHGSASAALEALPDVAAAAGVRAYRPAPRNQIEAEWEKAVALGATPLLLGAEDYPPLLATISDAPPFMWGLGDVAHCKRSQVALVGARNASAIGCRMAARLGGDLGKLGFGVVSGLARGIDAAAHKAALKTGTIAVQAGGVDTIYPPGNAALASEIAEHGLRLSEMPIGHNPRAQDFPRRNRIISGIAHGVVVIEGAMRSGSLITARNALDQGRDVMAVPGSPLDPRAGGCNALIRDGATLVRSAEDVAEALGGAPGPISQSEPALDAPVSSPTGTRESGKEPRLRQSDQAASKPQEAPSSISESASGPASDTILERLGPVPISEDLLARDLGMSAGHLAVALTDLELMGQIRRHPGGQVSLG